MPHKPGNNLTIGGWDAARERPFAYYETIAGGAGATPRRPGANAIHTHMTNTLNTPIEAIEYTYPLRVTRYEVRANFGGEGRFAGGDGIVREIELLSDAEVTILSDRRRFAPYGLASGGSAKVGRNVLVQGDAEEELPGKFSRMLARGDRIRIETPGGGGHGQESGST